MPAAVDLYRRLEATESPPCDLDQPGFGDAVWGLIEMHRTDLARPLLELWRLVRPDSSEAWSTAMLRRSSSSP